MCTKHEKQLTMKDMLELAIALLNFASLVIVLL